MSVWFEGRGEINCAIQDVKHSLENHGELFAGIVSNMPGMASVELMDQGGDFVTIETNEGLMKRTNISKHADAERVVVEFDERYEAGSKVSTSSHFSHEFATTGGGVMHRLVISDVEAPGFLGFFYRRFGSSKIGDAFLAAYKAHFDTQGR